MTLSQLTIYPAQLDPIIILRNSTFRKRFIVKINGTELNLGVSGTIIDADIKDSTGLLIGTFTSVLPLSGGVPIPGMFDLQLTPAQTLLLPVAKNHQTDISITTPNTDRFYYASAVVDVRETVSRNS